MNEYIALLKENNINFLVSSDGDSICFTLNDIDYEIFCTSGIIQNEWGRCSITGVEDLAVIIAL